MTTVFRCERSSGESPWLVGAGCAVFVALYAAIFLAGAVCTCLVARLGAWVLGLVGL